ncbi:MAG: phenylalanine--tRNA ligase subunit beta [Candidatus Diapherotrites archaeon]|nr:phenylalanine--tRNA ligase subunit beta [Candidatus Diapherotrites archaeon]
MPTIQFSKKDLEGLVGKKFSQIELENALLFVKGEVDKAEGDRITLDVKETNRPDLWSVEGIARELRARLGKEKGLPRKKFAKPLIEVIVDHESTRARTCASAAVIKNAKITPEFLEQVIQLQEKIAQTFGRRRKEAALGVYEFDRITPPIHYKGFSPREKKFRALDSTEELSLEEILEKHAKGKEFGHLLRGQEKYPLWIDSKGEILSLPPIINSEKTGRIMTGTKNVFLEATGNKQEIVDTAVLVMALAFQERGAQVHQVKIRYGKKTIVTPRLENKKISLGIDYVQQICGKKMNAKEISRLLSSARYEPKIKGKKIEAAYPGYRHDILHPIDAIEDILISMGYDKITPQKTGLLTRGNLLPQTILKENCREACVGMGLQEVLTYNLTSKEKQAAALGLKNEELVEIENPMSQNYCVFRKRIFPELLEFLNKNKHNPLPQRIFEVGKTVAIDPTQETGVNETDTVCMVVCEKNADFTRAKSMLESFCKTMGLELKTLEAEEPFLEKGRSAKVLVNGREGFIGEINSDTLSNFGLEEKTIVVEVPLE